MVGTLFLEHSYFFWSTECVNLPEPFVVFCHRNCLAGPIPGGDNERRRGDPAVALDFGLFVHLTKVIKRAFGF